MASILAVSSPCARGDNAQTPPRLQETNGLFHQTSDSTIKVGKPNPLQTGAEMILNLKNHELIHFCFLRRGFVGKEAVHDTQIDSCINTQLIFTL